MLRKSLVVLVLAIGIGIWAFLQKPSHSTTQESNFETTIAKLITKQERSPQGTPGSTPLEKKLHQEAALIARIDSASEDTEERLQQWAQTLSVEDLNQLEKTALDIAQPQDDRFLAVMLMGWSEKAEALENLKDIALSEIDPFLSPNRTGEFERVLRMQAVDGMMDLPAPAQTITNTLQDIAAKTSETSTADRANRALWASRGDAPKPKEQDKTALDELLKKPKRN